MLINIINPVYQFILFVFMNYERRISYFYWHTSLSTIILNWRFHWFGVGAFFILSDRTKREGENSGEGAANRLVFSFLIFYCFFFKISFTSTVHWNATPSGE